MQQIKGVVVPLLTPLHEDESPDFESLQRLVDYVVAGGVDAIFSMGTTGEFVRFDSATRGAIAKQTVTCAGGRVPVYVGVTDGGTARVLENVRCAEAAGADAVVLSLPYYIPNTSAKEALGFFQSIAQATKLPLVLYDIPAAVGSSIPLEVVEELMRSGAVAAIKVSGGDTAYLRAVLDLARAAQPPVSVLIGNESLNYLGLSLGADGITPSLANVFPKLLAAVYRSAAHGDLQALRRSCGMVDEINRLNSYSDSWMSPNIWRKTALKMMGIMQDYFTKPYLPVDQQVQERIAAYIARYRAMYPE